MKKLRQRKIFKIKTSYIAGKEYDFSFDFDNAKLMQSVISVANNQVFAAIERITGKNCNYKLVDLCYKKIAREKKKEKPSKQYLSGVRDQIDQLLFLNEIINVKVDDKKAYRHICKHGFICNGEKYVRLLCGAGMARRSTVSFCQEKIYKKLDEILRCGLVIDEINIAKYNAYYGLYMSGCYEVTTPRFIVVPDCELDIVGNDVDFIVDTKKITPAGEEIDCRKIEPRDFVFKANVFDGGGLVSPQMAQIWANDLEAAYIPANYIIRSAFIKGMVCVFDFVEFANQFCTPDETGKHVIIDCYGKSHYIEDIDVILTESQFKMHKKYMNLEEYLGYAKLYGHIWGISRFSKKKDQEYSLTNYQYIQTLDLDDEGINELTEYTIDWLRNICSGDELYTKEFVFGRGHLHDNPEENKFIDQTDLGWVKALCLNWDLFKDDYIRRKVYQAIKNRIDDAKIGRLWVCGNYQTMIPDPFALAQHAMGLEVTGLVKKDEYYSKFWADQNVTKVDCCRSPMVDPSEHRVVDIVSDKNMQFWYQYLDSGIVMNIWGLDTIVFSDSDFDGDIVFSTDNKVMIDNVYPGRLPITYDKESAPAQRLNRTNLIKTDLRAFDCKIGQTTNYSTKFFSMLCNYERDSREYGELVERIKLLRRYIGDSIDAGKGVKTKPFPSEWKSWKRVPENWTEEQKKEQWFLNNLVEKKKPYFFVYIYDSLMKDYNLAKKKMNSICRVTFGVNFNELKARNNKTEEEKNFIKKYYDELPVTKTPCIMNKMAWKIEDLEFDFKYPKNTQEENLELANMLSGKERKFIKTKQQKIREIFNFWKTLIKMNQTIMKSVSEKNEDRVENNWVNTDFAFDDISRKLEQIIPNDQELADYLVDLAYRQDTKMKCFCWRFAWKGIIENLKQKGLIPIVPVADENGVEILGEKYILDGVLCV